MVRDFVEYAEKLIREIPYVDASDVKELADWIDDAPYGGDRKRYFHEMSERLLTMYKKIVEVECFIKDEDYPDIKVPRSINSPSDASKLVLAPLTQAIEKVTYKHFHKFFVKGTQPADWPQRLQATFAEDYVRGTDFSSMEAHHKTQFNGVIRYWMMHCIRPLGRTTNFRRLVARLIGGTNRCKTPMLTAVVDERLMSGAMWTSSANGMLNFMLMSYMTLKQKYPTTSGGALSEHLDEFRGVFEGDDGLCSTIPSPELISGLGLKLKMEEPQKWYKAAFCQIICNRDTMETLTNPLKVIRKLCWLPAKYAAMTESKRSGLIRAKALSYKFNFGNCPVVGPLLDKILWLTRGVDCRPAIAELNRYNMSNNAQGALRALEEKSWKQRACVNPSSRLLVEECYGIPVAHQLVLEKQIEDAKDGNILLDILPYVKPWQIQFLQSHLGVRQTIPPIIATNIDGTTSRKASNVDREFDRVMHNLYLTV